MGLKDQKIPQEIWDSKINPLLDELKLDSDQLCELIIELLDQGLDIMDLYEIKENLEDLILDFTREKE